MDPTAADVVFVNGSVYTVNPAQPWARTVVVKGDKIAYVGFDAAGEYIGSNTEVIDLEGKMILPGFIDAHMHLIEGAHECAGADASGDSLEEVLQKLKAFVREHPDLDFLRGFGWRHNAFGEKGPLKEDLDRIFPDRAAYISAMDCHSAWVNSAALRAAGISENTPDPIPNFSYFERDSSGEPTGTLREWPAMEAVRRKLEASSSASILAAMENWMPRESRAGVTAVFDAGTFSLEDQADGFTYLSKLEAQARLPLRVVGCFAVGESCDEPVAAALELKRRFQSELVQVPVLKIILDGGVESHTAALLEPYHDRSGFRGELLMPPERLTQIVRQAHAAGLDMHVHAIGDRTTRVTLDALDTALRETGNQDRRHTICHLQLVDRQDIPRFRRLGVIAQTTTIWATLDPNWTEKTLPVIGERAYDTYPTNTFFAAGVPVTFGSDWPASVYLSTHKPLDGIEIGVTRKILGDPEAPLLAPGTERLSLPQMIRGYTLNAAFQLHLENRVGSIEAGKQADLVVLEKNLFEVPPHEIHAVGVLLTMMNGKPTHRCTKFARSSKK